MKYVEYVGPILAVVGASLGMVRYYGTNNTAAFWAGQTIAWALLTMFFMYRAKTNE